MVETRDCSEAGRLTETLSEVPQGTGRMGESGVGCAGGASAPGVSGCGVQWLGGRGGSGVKGGGWMLELDVQLTKDRHLVSPDYF